jgi:hypothetical protein
MSDKDDDKLMAAAGKLATEISPERDLWPGIEAAIHSPKRSSWTPMFAQAAAVLLLVGASSMVTYFVVKEDQRVIEIVRPTLTTDTVAFADRQLLGREYEQAHGQIQSQLDQELERLSPETRADVERNLAVIRQAIGDINEALEKEPDNTLLQELLANAYRDELSIMQRVGNLTQQIMSRKDI